MRRYPRRRFTLFGIAAVPGDCSRRAAAALLSGLGGGVVDGRRLADVLGTVVLRLDADVTGGPTRGLRHDSGLDVQHFRIFRKEDTCPNSPSSIMDAWRD